MNREIDIAEISDGKIYDSNDMAKLGVDDCSGCHACCCGMGDSVNLDPYDIYRLERGLHKTFQQLLDGHIELVVIDGIIMPCLKMDNTISIDGITEKEACSYLDGNGRCSIHEYRPSICRLFPLGKIYENETHKYFLQVNECQKERQTKIKIKKWIGTPEFGKYEKYVDSWHYFIKGISERAQEMPMEQLKAVNSAIMQTFYARDYDDRDFYEQFEERMSRVGF